MSIIDREASRPATDEGHDAVVDPDGPAVAVDETGAGGVPHHRVAIIGTGFSGLGMAIRLRQRGADDFVVLERATDVGGTWRDNTYPGCACDVPSHLYSFSFALNPNWSRTFSPQPEIQEYLRFCAEWYGVAPFVRFGHGVIAARWDDTDLLWRITTVAGDLTAEILVAGNGALSEPSVPPVPGLDAFEGTVFHSAHWDHDHDLARRKVAVFGTGASAIQFVPEIQPEVDQLDVYQRTPAWIMPHPDRPIGEAERRLYRRVPDAQKLMRAGIYWARETFVLAFTRHRRLMELAARQARAHLAKQVPDPDLRRRLTPDYDLGCKRILLSNRFYPALTQPNVELVTDGIREVRGRSIVAADGTEREADTIIFGTGFHVTDNPMGDIITGSGGRSLAAAWQDGPSAYLGTTVPGFPNLFLMTGPNTGLGHSSMVFMIESQIAYVLDALRVMDERRIGAVDVRPEALADFSDRLQAEMEGTVWTSGCASWYLDANGRNSTLWPDFTWRFRRRTRRFDSERYVLTPARRRAPVPA